MLINQAEYPTNNNEIAESIITLIHNGEIEVKKGEFLAIMGPSGHGKSTLLKILCGIESPTSGKVIVDGHDLSTLTTQQKNYLRRNVISLFLQFVGIFTEFTPIENVALPLLINGNKFVEANNRAKNWLEKLGVQSIDQTSSSHLSVDQMKRIAWARAFVNNPKIILADEALDDLLPHSFDELGHMLQEDVRDNKRTIVLVVHDARIVHYADRILVLNEGQIDEEIWLKNKDAACLKQIERKLEGYLNDWAKMPYPNFFSNGQSCYTS